MIINTVAAGLGNAVRRTRPTILLAADYFRPGYLAGGPIRTLGNLVDRLGDEFDFRVLTRHHDFSDLTPYAEVPADCWHDLGPAQVRYISAGRLNAHHVAELVRETPHSVLYLNSFFSAGFSVPLLWARKRGAIPSRPLILAPRGEFAPEALAIKAPKKRLYLAAVGLLGLAREVQWQASGDHEVAQIHHCIGADVSVTVAPNLAPPLTEVKSAVETKEPGRLRIAFLARISRMKNLEGALAMLAGVQGEVIFSLYGPHEDLDYWEVCRRMMMGLPTNIRVEVMGPVAPDRIGQALAGHDLFFLPTRGENFGHAILEALLAGLPVLISDRTPWRGLTGLNAGWDLPLEAPEQFTAVLQECVAADGIVWAAKRAAATALGRERAADVSVVAVNRNLFLHAIEGRR